MKKKILNLINKLSNKEINEENFIKELLSSLNDCFSESESEDLDEAIKIFEIEHKRKLDWRNDTDALVVSAMQVAISHIRKNR